jgi:hypothetical protein
VDHYDFPIARELHVELDHVRAELFRTAKGDERILGPCAAGSAVRDDEAHRRPLARPYPERTG